MLWLVFAVLTIAVVLVLLFPLFDAGNRSAESRVAYDMVVYRDQLAEIDDEIAGDLLNSDQAKSARAEIHRRMLAAEDSELDRRPAPLPADTRRAQLLAVVAIALIVPVGAAALYGSLGSPRLAGKPYAWRIAHDPDFASAATAELLAEQLNTHPSVNGYRRLASLYFSARNFTKAADADKHAIDLGANDPETWSEFGEAVAMSADGMIVPAAMMAFTNALSENPHDERARFYVGLAESQIGNARTAVAIWRDLLATAAPDAPWADMVKEHIASSSNDGGFDPNTVVPAPPSLDALKAAVAGMTSAMKSGGAQPAMAPAGVVAGADDPQMTMIRAMVARLAQRMEQNPGDPEGWRKLAHAYVVLGDGDKARAAIAHAVKLKPGDPAIQATLAETQNLPSPHAEMGTTTPAQSSPNRDADDPQMTMIRAMVERLAQRMERNPGDADGWRRLAHAYVVLGITDKARAAIARAVQLEPDDVGVLETLAETQQLSAPRDEVPAAFLATLRRVLKADPNYLPGLYYEGLAEAQGGHAAAARALWNKALLGPHDPNDPLMIAMRNRLGAMR